MSNNYRYAIVSVLVIGILISTGSSTAIAARTQFNSDLYYGMRNSESVRQLQIFLTNEGNYTGPVTGNFYSLTREGVKSFQRANAISPAYGYFGPLSRRVANQKILLQSPPPSVPAMPPASSVTPVILPPQSLIATTSSIAATTSDPTQEQLQSILLELQRSDVLNKSLITAGPNGCKTVKECQDYCAQQTNISACQSFFGMTGL